MQSNYNQSSNYYVVTIENNGDIKGCPYEQFTRNAMATKLGITTNLHELTLAQNKELQETVDLYYNKLVELKVITPPKTPEELQKEQADAMQAQADLINKQSAAMDEMLSIIKELKASTAPTPIVVPATTQEPVTVENPLPVVVVEDKLATPKAKGVKK